MLLVSAQSFQEYVCLTCPCACSVSFVSQHLVCFRCMVTASRGTLNKYWTAVQDYTVNSTTVVVEKIQPAQWNRWKSWSGYTCVYYRKKIRFALYFPIETLFYRKSCRQTIFNFTKLSLLCWRLQFLVRIFNFIVSTFWRPDFLVPRPSVTNTFWRRNILPSKKKK